MKHRMVPQTKSSTRAALSGLAVALGIVAGCGTATDEAPAGREPAVGSVEQRFDQILDPPHDPQEFVRAPPCEDGNHDSERNEYLGPEGDDGDVPVVTCSLTLNPNERIRRRLALRGGPTNEGGSNGVVINCQDQLREKDKYGNVKVPSFSSSLGNTEILGIRSNMRIVDDIYQKDPATGFYEGARVEHVLVQNCTIAGKVVIAGLTRSDRVEQASHDIQGLIGDGLPNFVERARHIAPRNITFHNVRLIGLKATPLYIHTGVSRFTMVDSIVDGHAGSDPGIYLSPETTENTILNTKLTVRSDSGQRGREQVAVDGSSYNFLIGNTVSGLDDGGYVLFRNCGEQGPIRYNTPSYNVIARNKFIYDDYHLSDLSRDRYAVWMSSRNGSYSKYNYYCYQDMYEPGTNRSDNAFPRDLDTSFSTAWDNAHDNIVTENEFLNRWPKDYIKSSSKLANFYSAGNHRAEYTLVNRTGFSEDKRACYSPGSFGRVLLHGNSEIIHLMANGDPLCVEATCDDGHLETIGNVPCPAKTDPITVECRVHGSNDGCGNFKSCPLGTKVKSVKAACNLESGPVLYSDMRDTADGTVRVVTPSTKASDGVCYVLSQSISTGGKPLVVQQQLSWEAANGSQIVTPTDNGVRTVNVGCKEKDKDGGDCHVRAEFTCE